MDGNPYAPLPEGVKADLQAEIDQLYQMFTAHVGAMRGIGQQAAASTEARMYMGAQAVSQGLADRVGTLETEFQRLRDSAGANRGAGSRRFATRQGVKSMSGTQQGGEPNTPPSTPAAGNTTAQTPVLELTTAELEAAKATAFEAGVTAERGRITGIMAVGVELGMGNAITNRMISGGQTLETARDLMTSIKEATDTSTHINTAHSAGTTPSTPAASIDTAAIYAARNGGR